MVPNKSNDTTLHSLNQADVIYQISSYIRIKVSWQIATITRRICAFNRHQATKRNEVSSLFYARRPATVNDLYLDAITRVNLSDFTSSVRQESSRSALGQLFFWCLCQQ